ncbi:MAG: hypothetical protein ACREMJ_04180 [Gemmatimonadales bacterium]
MRSAVPTLLVLAALAAPLAARGQQRPAPLPDHWLTLDSLIAILGLTTEQKTKVTEPYTALNAVLEQAAGRRERLRGTMPRAGGSPGEMTPEQRQAMRARMDSVRAEFETLQAEADEWHAAIRNLLSAEQQARFDALPKPRAFRERRGPGGP